MGRFRVAITPPEGTWLQSYDAVFGLTLSVGRPGRMSTGSSTIRLGTNCEGGCEANEQAARIASAGAERVFELLQPSASKVEWVIKPDASNPLLTHVRALDAAGKSLQERVEVAHPQPAGREAWFNCAVSVRGEHIERIEELKQWCQSLEPRFEGKDAATPEANFGGRYVLAGRTIEFPTPAGFRFAKYDVAMGEVAFRGDYILNSLHVHTTCAGECSAGRLESNIRDAARQRLERRKERDQDPVEEIPLEPTTDGLLRERVRYTAFKTKPAVDVRVIAIVPGLDRALECNASLLGDRTSAADEVEAICVRALSTL